MPQTEPWTIGRLLTWTTDYLGDRGSESPRLEAEVLLAEARDCERIELYTAFDEVAGDQTRVAFRELVRRRAEGMPVAYLVGRREFYAMTFYVTQDVLIPRPETEFVVVGLLDLARQHGPDRQPLEIADVGTGSGVLAVCAAKHVAESRVTALDISPSALEIAQRNAALHGVEGHITFLRSDLFAAIPVTRRFDFIVSNPPYVSSDEFHALPDEIRRYEPREALVAGPRGTEIIERLLPQAAARLAGGGWLLLEISPMIETAVKEIAEESEDWESISVIKDLAGLPRVVKLRRREGAPS